jgi:hypothetical protein
MLLPVGYVGLTMEFCIGLLSQKKEDFSGAILLNNFKYENIWKRFI